MINKTWTSIWFKKMTKTSPKLTSHMFQSTLTSVKYFAGSVIISSYHRGWRNWRSEKILQYFPSSPRFLPFSQQLESSPLCSPVWKCVIDRLLCGKKCKFFHIRDSQHNFNRAYCSVLWVDQDSGVYFQKIECVCQSPKQLNTSS